MTPEEYLQILRKKLKGIPKEDQVTLIEEIGSHIECGEEDARMGNDPTQRRDKLMDELGSPEKMAKGFKNIYQSGGLINYLLVAIPYLLNLPINLLLVSIMPKHPWADARLVIIFHLLLIGIGLWRRSKLVAIFWLADLAVQLMGILLYVKGYYGTLQTLFWCTILAGLVIQLGRMVWQNRRDTLIVIFALLPIIMGIAATVLWIFHQGRSIATHWGPLDLFLYQLSTNYANFFYYLEIIALAPLFLVKDCNLRWLSLAIFGLTFGVMRQWLDYSAVYPPVIYYLWIILPITTIFLGWWMERTKRERLGLLA